MEKKKGMVDINLRYVAAVTSLRGDLTFLKHSYQSYLKYLEEILTHRRVNRRLHWTCAKTVGHCIT